LSYASTNGDLYTSTQQNARYFLTSKRAVQRVQTYNLFAPGCQPGIFVFSESNRSVASHSFYIRKDRNLAPLSSPVKLLTCDTTWTETMAAKKLSGPLDNPDCFCHI